ncbi:MAG: bifunctional DNA-formamidopyrimidine glycosylase/DNA-(apurinic or apyrimidinic site) lyase [Alphaproteobacteria bacterium]
MPELPEVETVRRGLLPVMKGRRIARVEARRPDLRVPIPRDLKARLEGRRVAEIGRRAKYLLIELESGDVCVVHLGMSGRLFIEKDDARPIDAHDHITLTMDNGARITLNDPRRFGLVALMAKAEMAKHKLFAAVGPEPLAEAFDGRALEAAFRGRKTSLKAALLDQRLVAGLGNIYVCEALFHAGLSPKRRAGTVRGETAAALAAAIKRVLNEAIASGGSSLRDYIQPSGELGYFQHRWAVYDKEGKPCPGCDCGADAKVNVKGRGVRRFVQGGRSTFYCPRRQR